jgi:hypothetical protein
MLSALGPVALGVVEEPPIAVGFNFHPPAEFGVVGLGVDEPGVRVSGALDLLGVDDFAVRVEYSIISHAPGVTRCGRAESHYSPVNFGGRFSNVAVIPSVRSFEGRNAEFHAAT